MLYPISIIKFCHSWRYVYSKWYYTCILNCWSWNVSKECDLPQQPDQRYRCHFVKLRVLHAYPTLSESMGNYSSKTCFVLFFFSRQHTYGYLAWSIKLVAETCRYLYCFDGLFQNHGEVSFLSGPITYSLALAYWNLWLVKFLLSDL